MRDGLVNGGCSETFQELCALEVASELTPAERKRLEDHLLECASCRSLLLEYQEVAGNGMGRVAALRAEAGKQPFEWNREPAKKRLLASIASTGTETRTSNPVLANWAPIPEFSFLFRPNRLIFQALAVVVFAVWFGYTLGRLPGRIRPQNPSTLPLSAAVPISADDSSLRSRLAESQEQLARLNETLTMQAGQITALQDRADRAEKELANVVAVKGLLETQIQKMSGEKSQQADTLAALTKERDTLEQKQRETANTLQAARQELASVQSERQKLLAHASGLEASVADLSTKFNERDETARRAEQYLASDRDIRELMGARQLYIADVFDIDSHGRTRAPFGRIFYTKGKSLIFYAFDLDQQPGYRDAKAFQVWGSQGAKQAAPVSLGILYIDNEANRRWVLKSRDTKTLEEINTVFVTVEPHGGSKKPTAKPFLLAYLRTAAPNHP